MTTTNRIVADLRRRARLFAVSGVIATVVAYLLADPQARWGRWSLNTGSDVLSADLIGVSASFVVTLFFTVLTVRSRRLPWSAMTWARIFVVAVVILGVVVCVNMHSSYGDDCVQDACASLAGPSTANWVAEYVLLVLGAALCAVAVNQAKAAERA